MPAVCCTLGVEGVGEHGIVENRASTIRQIAVDPGPDGVDAVVRSSSAIINQAKQITLQSNQAADNGYFSRSPKTTDGVYIHSDKALDIDASVSVEARTKDIDEQLKNLNSAATSQNLDAISAMTAAETLCNQMNTLLALQDPLTLNELTMRTTVTDLDDLTEQFYSLLPTVYNALENAAGKLSNLAETKRRIKSLTDEKTEIGKIKTNFDTKSTDAVLHVDAEQMFFNSIDGDGKLRTNKEASISVQTGKVDINTLKPDGTLIEESHGNINAGEVNVLTGYDKRKDDGSIEESVMDGKFTVCSKNVLFSAYGDSNGKLVQTKDSRFDISMESLAFVSADENGASKGNFRVFAENQSFEARDKDSNAIGSFKVRAKDMTLDSSDKDCNTIGSLNVKAENMTFASTDNSGKAIGQLSMNSKDVFVKSMDTDDKGTDKNLASGGNMVLVAEKMFVGRTDKDNSSKELQVSSDKTGIYGKTTAEIQQGEAKAVVQLDGGNVAIGGSKADFYGNNTVYGKTDFQDDVTAPEVVADNLQAKVSFKSKNISDGVAVPGAPSSAKISAKLKETDAPKPKSSEKE